jgi:hypothetical protein
LLEHSLNVVGWRVLERMHVGLSLPVILLNQTAR